MLLSKTELHEHLHGANKPYTAIIHAGLPLISRTTLRRQFKKRPHEYKVSDPSREALIHSCSSSQCTRMVWVPAEETPRASHDLSKTRLSERGGRCCSAQRDHGGNPPPHREGTTTLCKGTHGWASRKTKDLFFGWQTFLSSSIGF